LEEKFENLIFPSAVSLNYYSSNLYNSTYMSTHEQQEKDYSFYDLFYPLTTGKAIIFIIIIGFIVFFNALFNGFVGDDYGQILSNSAILSVKNIPIFFRASTFITSNALSGLYYKPLLLTTYTIIYSIFGENAFFFHSFQVILFIANAILVFLLFKKFINLHLAFILSLIFLVHPINQSVAAYIATLQDTMFFFFGMLALLVTISDKIKYSYLITFFLLALSLLSKETGIAFVFINFLYIALFKKRLIRNTLILSFILLLSYVIVHFLTVGTNFLGPQMYHISRLPFQERLFNIPAIIIFYLQTFLFPSKLAVSYDWVVTKPDVLNFYIPLLIIILFLFTLLLIGKKIKKKTTILPSYLFFVLWFFIGLSFHLQIIPLDGTVATSWFYFPIVGIIGAIGLLVQSFKKNILSQIAIKYFLVVLILLLSIVTIWRNSDFKDNLTLTCHDANETHSNFVLEFTCGNSLALYAQSYDEAQKHIELSISLAPYYFANWDALGMVLGTKGVQTHNMDLIRQAEDAFRTSIKNDPYIPDSYELLGYLYVKFNNPQMARTFLINAIERFPSDYKLWLYLAAADYKTGDRKSATNAINKAYILSNKSPAVISAWKTLVKNE
jgi:hypothetical protein